MRTRTCSTDYESMAGGGDRMTSAELEALTELETPCLSEVRVQVGYHQLQTRAG